MKMPHGAEAVVPLPKLAEYLLSERHPVGRFKATFFRRLGFRQGTVQFFEKGRLAIARNDDAVEVITSLHGTKYIVDGVLETPDGASVAIRTVWIVELNQYRPRFVTAYPR